MKTYRDIHIFQDINEIADYVVERWAEIAGDEIKKKGYFSAALSGGKTPVPLYEKLAGIKTLPWDKTHVFIVDERFVPYDSEDNNYHMISRVLLRHVNITPKCVHPIMTSGLSPETSAIRYEKDLLSYCKSTRTAMPQFDLTLLGIGDDGHTASLFPGTAALKEREHLAVAVLASDNAIKERITLTFPVINNSKNVYFMVEGEKKASIIRNIIEETDCPLPAAMVNPQKGKLSFLLDKDAGALLSEQIN